MKTQFYSYIQYTGVLLCSMLLLFSCTKEEDGPEPGPEEKSELVLTPSETEIDKGDTVTFEITADGKAVDADIYINNDKISGASYTFEEAGTYQVIAKKEGYTDSEAIDIKSYQVDVYVAGSDFGGAVYWKNGTIVPLTDGKKSGSRANDILVDNEDVYISGGDGGLAVYWKNGTRITMETSIDYPAAYGRSIALDNGNVYISGEQTTRLPEGGYYSTATYWKNGVPVDLRVNGQAIAMAVEDGDVHLVARENDHPKKIANYWKNDSHSILAGGDYLLPSAMTVENGDVYITGVKLAGFAATTGTAVYWKNGTLVSLNRERAHPMDIAVDNGDIYIVANDFNSSRNSAIYWKNGELIALTDGRYTPATTTSIAVNNGDVYITGSYDNDPVYWKNGTRVTLEGVNAEAYSIFVTRSLGGN